VSTAAIVCGYELSSDLRAYVSELVLRLAQTRPDLIVVSGGYTSPQHTECEAEVMAHVIEELMPDVPVLVERRAMTTLDNLVFSRRFAERTLGAIDAWVVGCGRLHARKVRILARLVLGRGVRVIDVPRPVSRFVRVVEAPSIVIETVAALLPPLRLLISAIAARMKGVSAMRPLRAPASRRSASTSYP
jgi:DUF218 domain